MTLIFVCLVSFAGFAQFNKNNRGSRGSAPMDLRDRVFFGGGGGFSAGTYPSNGLRYTYFAVNPLVGFRVTPAYSFGVQVLYQTYRFSQVSGLNLNQYGIAPFMQYRVGPVFAYAEYQMINALNQNGDKRSIYTRFPIGLGYTKLVGPRAAFNVVVLYDVLYNTRSVYSPFASPLIVRIYITAGGVSF